MSEKTAPMQQPPRRAEELHADGFSFHYSELRGPRSLCSRDRCGGPWVGFALRTQAQRSTENMADPSHEGRGGRRKPDVWPAPGTLKETLTLTTSMSI